MTKVINIIIDEKPVKANYGFTIMQSCAQSGVDVPRFCYHDKLLIAGNCRICLVEVLGSKKLLASCAVHVSENVAIYTNTSRVRLARQNVLEFLLANHPLDCPICDQGGECDLQDITAVFGADRGRFYENKKRAVMNKDFGPLIRTSMNRCIHCTRCVRFLTLSSGNAVLGTLGRGSSTEIGGYINKFLYDELSGNITDLCPVGALTSKPYSFKARPWELTSIETIDAFDALNSNTLVDIAANKICRVLPYANELVNEGWLTNKARYAYDGLFIQRINSCLFKSSFNLVFLSSSSKLHYKEMEFFVKLPWNAAFLVFACKLFSSNVSYFFSEIGGMSDLDSAYGLKLFSNLLGADSMWVQDSSNINSLADYNFLFLFNTSLLDLSNSPSFCLFIGTNVRFEAPLLNLRLNQLYNEFSISFYRIGASINYSSYPVRSLSNNLQSFFEICEFKHPFCRNFYIKSFVTRPFILVGQSLLNGVEGSAFFNALLSLGRRLIQLTTNVVTRTQSKFGFSGGFSFFGILSTYSSQLHIREVGMAGSPLNFTKHFSKNLLHTKNVFLSECSSVWYAVGVDTIDVIQRFTTKSSRWLVYQGSHGNGLASFANLIFPTTTFIERSVFYKNLLGLVQRTKIAVTYDIGAKTDLEVFKGITSSVFSTFLIKFFTFNFCNGISYNLEFLFNRRLFLTTFSYSTGLSHAVQLYVKTSFLTKHFDSLLFSYYYLYVYASYFSSVSLNNATIDQPLMFIAGLFPQTSSLKLFNRPLASSVVNYYGDSTVPVLLASKSMSLCSNIYVKKNFSLSQVYC